MTTREQRRREWVTRIADYRSSGLTMTAWCTANHFSKEQLKYWLRKTKEDSASVTPAISSRFVPLTVTNQPDASVSSLVVRIGQASVEIRSGFDPHLFRKIVQALETPC
ncbi:IS66 family insertion sequence element accessory protein TnpA [Brevibacillus sp. SAFN-007a]|uniref:IS66 family insertion sequence element accessory protein TnpA n=1 Tax=Brevibacillus sp. SAFN-007a TaxID=3436862 RepID=UPI003F7D9FCD